ncbi:hypothetical protein LOTGIDRAFT_163300 [Lottia gigantea]|uniref:Tetratricopeptide repeat protein 17 n=1 Tax=Lottia gigantea TaxID=225164 RepID=V4A941_LOTGI|nr:hypothetical protein LOTGIDRAFT_163300 [Lottia gigantea]ESO91575.1 hypothetical protein LOTGIDRAFT_163300 [Lottia gigantea]
MASSVVVIVLLHFLFEQCLLTRGSMHWVVTEDGRIQSQADSVYNLRRPYDLVAFMHQEDRATVLNHLKKELLNRKGEIDKSEDRDTTGLEQKFYKSDYDCLQAGTPLPEIDLYISTILPIEHKHISDELSIEIQKAAQSSDNKIGTIPPEPDCTKVLQLDFTPHGFEHLEGVQERMNLTGSAELGLTHAIPFIPDKTEIPDFGHVIAKELKKNSTSWVLYNMAAFYWRVKGDPWMTVECLRRALHFSPRENKDIALISLGNILHRARYSNEAAIVVHSALELSKELNVNHFTLGNIYAVLGEYNKSIICYENTLRIQPDFEAATIRKHAVLCHQKLEAALEAQHRSLQKTLRDLKDYQKKHDLWHIQNDRMSVEQVSQEEKVSQNIAFEFNKAKQTSTKDIGEYCNMVEREGKQVLLCTWNRQAPTLEMLDQFALEEQKKESERNRLKLNKYEKKAIDYNLPVRAPLYVKHDRQAVPRFNELELDNTWPEKEECDSHLLTSPDPFNLSTVYLSPENKGFEVKALLTEAQNLKDGAEHPLPWYPPICVTLLTINEYDEKTYDNLKSVGHPGRTKVPLKMYDPSMRKTLLSHVNGGTVTEEEVGQRILSAIKQEVGARWVLFNLAGLYWRIVGNNYHGIECIRRSLALAPDEYADVPLVNMANILYKWGRYDDAIVLMKDALKINDAEPDSNFLMANLLWVTKNYSGAISHYRTVLDIIPEHQEAFDSLRAIKCLQKFLIKEQSVAPIEVPSQPVGNSCQQKGVANKNQQTESRVICKTENGEEKCIIETRMRGKSGECNGHCTQTCTITPIKVESSCGGPDLAVDTSNPVQCHQKGSQCGEAGEELLFTNDFTNKLDEVSDHYEKKGICNGEDCNTLRVQCLIPMKTHSGLVAHVITPPKLFVRPLSLHSTQCMTEQKKPHIKLEFIDGVLHQKLIFVQDANDIHVEDNECIIFNDGIKSPGCDQAQYRSYSEELARSNINVEFRYVGDESPVEKDKKNHCSKTPNSPGVPSDEIPYSDISDGILQSLNGDVEPSEVVGHRIALTLQQNPKSWVAASAAGLYWRVEGDFTKALDCYRLSLSYAPLEMADLMLLGYANILVQGGYYSNAIMVEDLALDIQSTLPIHYFTLGNIYAALGKWRTAVSFYEATRFYQEDFKPAVDRLRAIHCENIA